MFRFGKKKKLKKQEKIKTLNKAIKNFDEDAYLEANPDVQIGIENGNFQDVKHHLETFGLNEIEQGLRRFHSDFSEFDEEVYLNTFPGISNQIDKNTLSSAFDHFRTKGYQEIVHGERVWKKRETDTEQENNDISKKNDVLAVEYKIESDKEDKKKKEFLDVEFYSSFYNDMHKVNSKKKIIQHWKEFGIAENRYPNIDLLCKAIEFKFDLAKLDTDTVIKLNPLLSTLNKSEILIKVLQVYKIDLIRLSKELCFDANFYLLLGESYLIRGEKEIAHQILLYSLYLDPVNKCNELLGNYYLDKGQHKHALKFYLEALQGDYDYKSLWLHINTNKVYRTLNDHFSALDVIVSGLKKFPEDSRLLKILDETIHQTWDFEQENLHALSKTNNRKKLIESVNILVSVLSKTYREVFRQEGKAPVLRLNPKRVLIIGDFHVPQCIRYRIDQKEEQLVLTGYEVTKVSWTELHENYDEIFFHDIIIYYRVPAQPVIIKSIEKARSLGKITFYEIDDLIFDPVYPSAYETYGGNISIEEYAGLTYGMPLFQAAAMLCEYAIASTLPLLSLLEPLVTSRKGFLHRNGLDSLNVFMLKKEKEYINIFYGSGTLAHNSDFLELTLGAVERILSENKNVKLTIVGHLTLPESFRKQFKKQVILLEKTSTIEHYWSYLSGADINLAVLHNDIINNSKSELKWFEAACFKIPSIVSNTQNYLDVIDDGEDALIAGTTEEWYSALHTLVKDKGLRDEMGQKAYEKVIENYSLKTLSENLDTVLKEVLKDEKVIENYSLKTLSENLDTVLKEVLKERMTDV